MKVLVDLPSGTAGCGVVVPKAEGSLSFWGALIHYASAAAVVQGAGLPG